MTVERARTWLRNGKLFISAGFIDDERGQRFLIQGGELHLRDGYLCLNGPPGEPPYRGPERRLGCRRGIERRRWPVLSLPEAKGQEVG